ncbi:hypothetical protein PAEPH01_1705 [Pancytospora epiphaga]|nr:hypothetical protein PAEPH01_1705 [Pancytospora epiphaga]
MADTLPYRLDLLEQNIYILKQAVTPDITLIADINSQLAVADSLFDFYDCSGEVIARYNTLKLQYAELFTNKRLYYSADRAARIDRIVKDSEYIADIQELIREYLVKQSESVDRISINLAHSHLHTDAAVSEIAAYRTHVKNKTWWWRLAATTLAIGGGIWLYRLFSLR